MKSLFRQLCCALIVAAIVVSLSAAGLAQSSQDELYNQAIQDYAQNQFSSALDKFQKITGPRARDAQQYIVTIKAYKDAMSAAMSIMDRSPDERDANSLEYAIEKLQEAIKIKPDGPWQPAQQLEKAKQLKAQIVQQKAAMTAEHDRQLCTKALAAAGQHHYKDAALLVCPVANDNPGYACGGDEAAHMCEQMNDLAKLDKSPPPAGVDHPIGSGEAVSSNSGSGDAAFEKAKTEYDRNDFARAQKSLRQVSGDSKSAADEYLDKISRYQDAMTQGNEASQNAKYEDAATAYRNAAAVKPDGPGSPQAQALLMELMIGLDQFYSGDYVSATQHLETYAHQSSDRQPLVHFYLGASKLSRFFLTGNQDTNLRQDALNDLRIAKQSGFKTTGQDVSPKVLQAYKDLAF